MMDCRAREKQAMPEHRSSSSKRVGGAAGWGGAAVEQAVWAWAEAWRMQVLAKAGEAEAEARRRQRPQAARAAQGAQLLRAGAS